MEVKQSDSLEFLKLKADYENDIIFVSTILGVIIRWQLICQSQRFYEQVGNANWRVLGKMV